MIDPSNAEVLLKKGSILVELGKHDEGIKYFDKILERSKSYNYFK